eukprot:867850-Pelagomonas_calceolata.AAC.1
MTHLKNLAMAYLTTREGTNLHIRRQLNDCMRARQLISIYTSNLNLIKQNESLFIDILKSLMKISPFAKPLPTPSLY